MKRSHLVCRRELTDEQRQWIGPHLPTGEYGPYPERLRDQFEGVIWRFRTGAQWREMPGDFGPWSTVYGCFRVCVERRVIGSGRDSVNLQVGVRLRERFSWG